MGLNKQSIPIPTPTPSIKRTDDDELECFAGQAIIRQPQKKPGLNERFLSVQKNTLNPILTPSSLQQLMKYVPVKTWATYTTALSWIFSINSHSSPYAPGGNCDKLQHDLLIATLVVSSVSAFATVFARKFKYDSSGNYVIYPPPRGFTVTTQITDPKTNATFPCKTKNGQYCWPVFDRHGNFVYGETQGLQALLLKDGATIQVGERSPSRWFRSKKRSNAHTDGLSSHTSIVIESDDATSPPWLQPFWKRSIVGIKGAKYYLDFHPGVWVQASMSVLAFGTLSMFSTQVGKCLYPSVSDYVLSAIQTFLVLFIGGITALVMPDDSENLSEIVTQQFTVVAEDEDDNVPVDLYSVVERIIRIKKVSDGIHVEARLITEWRCGSIDVIWHVTARDYTKGAPTVPFAYTHSCFLWLNPPLGGMVVGTKRRKPVSKGLAPGERLKRDKLYGAEHEYSQWGWINHTSDSSSISMENMLTVYGFLDKFRKPICKNKYLKSKEAVKNAQMPDKSLSKDPRVMDKLKNEEDIIILSSDDEIQTCDKKACKDNPHCLNFLGQAKLENEEASRKAYLQASELEYDPFEEARDVDVPVGLKNLGATCYANAFIQVWFQDLAFRDGVYRCIISQEDGHPLEDSPIFQLQVTFAALQEGTQRVFNPIKLVESLKLRTFEQQDAQEFSKLFMNHLATEFEKQAVPSLKTLISDQFEGQQSYGTMCKKCKHRSEHDSNFLELEVGLEANGNRLEECIEVLLQSEELTDDNKYCCANCDSLQDAVRYTKLRRLPPVLHFSVLRFVFDVSTLERKKSKHAIVFPRLLDMSPFMEAQKSDPAVQVPSKREHPDVALTDDHLYELRGVLLHKGASAYHGHYEAQVFDVTKKQFYQFNDEVVTPISSLQIHKPTADEKLPKHDNRRTYARKKRRIVDSDIEADSSSVKDDATNCTSSKDAYMLIYARRDKESANAGISPKLQSLVQKSVEELNHKHEEACNAYLKKKNELVEKFQVMRSQKQKLYCSWCIEDVKEVSAVVSRKALEAWLSQGLEKPKKAENTDKGKERESQETNVSEAPAESVIEEERDRSESPIDPEDLINERRCNGPKSAADFVLDNTSIQCPHGALDPSKAHEMKRIRMGALQDITRMGYTFQPEFTTKDVCHSCILRTFNEKRYAIDHTNHTTVFDEFNESVDDFRGTWISKTWLRDWRQPKPKMHSPGKENPHPESPDYVEHVRCPHGQLSQSSTLRIWINEGACIFLQSLFPDWEPTITSSDEMPDCPSCEVSVAISKENRHEMKLRVDKEKESFRMLLAITFMGMEPEPTPGVRQAIIDAEFFRRWRTWIGRPYDKPRPESIDNSWLLCHHDKLVVDPSKDLGTSILLITLKDWEMFLKFYSGGPSLTWLELKKGLSPDPSSSTDVEYTDYEICDECRHQRLIDFDLATISIRLYPEGMEKDAKLVNGINHKEPAPKDKDTTVKRAQPLRVSHRLRDSNRKVKIKTITIHKEMTVKEMKIEIQDVFNIPTICQQLFLRGSELTDGSETVASLGILANEALDLKEEKEVVDMDSDVDIDSQRTPKRRREEGRAFGGTVLSGGDVKRTSSSTTTTAKSEPNDTDNKAAADDIKQSSPEMMDEKHCPMCTFINPADATRCSICDSDLV